MNIERIEPIVVDRNGIADVCYVMVPFRRYKNDFTRFLNEIQSVRVWRNAIFSVHRCWRTRNRCREHPYGLACACHCRPCRRNGSRPCWSAKHFSFNQSDRKLNGNRIERIFFLFIGIFLQMPIFAIMIRCHVFLTPKTNEFIETHRQFIFIGRVFVVAGWRRFSHWNAEMTEEIGQAIEIRLCSVVC